jgi:hypothetical protein
VDAQNGPQALCVSPGYLQKRDVGENFISKEIPSDVVRSVTVTSLCACPLLDHELGNQVPEWLHPPDRWDWGETNACQLRKHVVKSLSLFHFMLVIDNLHNSRGSQRRISRATGILNQIVIRQSATGSVESAVDRGGKDSLKFVTGGQTTLQSVRNVRVANKLREAPAGEPLGIQLWFV